MIESLQKYRPRSRKGHWLSADRIHTFWVGQRVIRSGSRSAFEDVKDDDAIITAIIRAGRSVHLKVERQDGTTSSWTPGEATPYRAWLDGNAKRLRARAKQWADLAKSVDDNGVLIQHPVVK